MPIVRRLFFLPFFCFCFFQVGGLHAPTCPPPALHATVPSLNATRMCHHSNRMSPFLFFSFLFFSFLFFSFLFFSFLFFFLFLFLFPFFVFFLLFSFVFVFSFFFVLPS